MNEPAGTVRAAGLRSDQLREWARTDLGIVHALDATGGAPAVELWRRLRALLPGRGYWPVILGPSEPGNPLARARKGDAPAVGDTLASAGELDGAHVLRDRAAERVAEFLEYNADENPEDYLARVGDWPPDIVSNGHFRTPYDVLSRKPHATVVFALVPTPRSWEVPAYLVGGGWNEYPDAAEHCAIMRYWHERYGSEIVAMTFDVIECDISRPPTNRDAALALAREQYAYCDDIVSQGTETLSNLAASLLNASSWYFWWD